jgi:glucosamine-6-phosphate deaminase
MTPELPPVRTFTVNSLQVQLANNRQELGQLAAQAAAKQIRLLSGERDFVNIIFASAPSQDEFLEALSLEVGIDWSRVRAFHMDEYMGLSAEAPQNFGFYLRQRLFDRVAINEVYYLDGNAPDPEQECLRYGALLAQYPTDIVCLGIGENCHIAFNDPHVADFADPNLVKIVALDLMSREQQVHDGCFAALDQVPTHALTLTIPALVNAPYLFCMVPASHKAEAINHTLTDPITEQYPATILRTHSNTTLFIDPDSARIYLENVAD